MVAQEVPEVMEARVVLEANQVVVVVALAVTSPEVQEVLVK